MPLAYDSINYKQIENNKYKEYDICFVGGWANNGFNEKRRIMLDAFSKFMKSGLNCGFFVEQNLSHEQECQLLYNSKVTLNLHDAYQRELGYDTNERTFKSLGLNGCLVSDTVAQVNRLFPNIRTSLDPNELVQITKDYLSLTTKELNDIKEENRQNILENHSYINRVQQFLNL
jgi:spore maturation protein CgeB